MREERIFQAVQRGDIVHAWTPIPVEHGNHHGVVYVSSDSLGVGEPDDFVRVTVNAMTEQRIADAMDAMLLTPRVCDLIYQKATTKLLPCRQSPDAQMSNTRRMVQHSREVDEQKRAFGEAGLCADPGKDWVLTNKLLWVPGRAANYGWHDPGSRHTTSVRGQRVWQPLFETRPHDLKHVDYSQTVRLMRRTMVLDGAEVPVDRVLSDPGLFRLLSSEDQPLAFLRYPVSLGEVRPTLRRGSRGAAVVEWQRIVGVGDDGIFGKNTENATKQWETAHGFTPDGVVTASEWSAAGA